MPCVFLFITLLNYYTTACVKYYCPFFVEKNTENDKYKEEISRNIWTLQINFIEEETDIYLFVKTPQLIFLQSKWFEVMPDFLSLCPNTETTGPFRLSSFTLGLLGDRTWTKPCKPNENAAHCGWGPPFRVRQVCIWIWVLHVDSVSLRKYLNLMEPYFSMCLIRPLNSQSCFKNFNLGPWDRYFMCSILINLQKNSVT